MARLTAVALWWCAWTVAAWEAGKKTGQDGWLDDHNYYRCLHGADPVGWDYTLESQAQAVANDNAARGGLSHSNSYSAAEPAGENLAMGMGTYTCGDYNGPYNQNCATHYWYEEVECWLEIPNLHDRPLNRHDLEEDNQNRLRVERRLLRVPVRGRTAQL